MTEEEMDQEATYDVHQCTDIIDDAMEKCLRITNKWNKPWNRGHILTNMKIDLDQWIKELEPKIQEEWKRHKEE